MSLPLLGRARQLSQRLESVRAEMLFLAAAAFVDRACLVSRIGSGCQAPSCGRIQPDVVERGRRGALGESGAARDNCAMREKHSRHNRSRRRRQCPHDCFARRERASADPQTTRSQVVHRSSVAGGMRAWLAADRPAVGPREMTPEKRSTIPASRALPKARGRGRARGDRADHGAQPVVIPDSLAPANPHGGRRPLPTQRRQNR